MFPSEMAEEASLWMGLSDSTHNLWYGLLTERSDQNFFEGHHFDMNS
jgi:hypothetical protein